MKSDPLLSVRQAMQSLNEEVKNLSVIAELEKRVKHLETMIGSINANAAIQVPGEFRIVAAKVRIDAPGGVEIQPRISTTMIEAVDVHARANINGGRINGLRVTKMPPFVLSARRGPHSSTEAPTPSFRLVQPGAYGSTASALPRRSSRFAYLPVSC